MKPPYRFYGLLGLLALVGVLFEVHQGMSVWGALFFQALWLAVILFLERRRSKALWKALHAERERREWAQTLFTNAASGILVVSEQGVIQECNPEASRIFGYADMVGLPVDRVIPTSEHTTHPVDKDWSNASDFEGFLGVEHLVRALRWDARPITIRLVVARAAYQHKLIYIANMVDVTEAVQTEQTLQRWLAVGTDLLVTSPFDEAPETRTFTFVSPSWEKVLGYTVSELQAVPWMDLVHEDEHAITRATALQMRETGQVQRFVNRYRHKEPLPDGSPRWVHIEWSGVYDQGTDTVFASGRDITGRVETEDQLLFHVAELTAANEDLQRFASVAAHQLRSPPRTISGVTQALLEDYGHLLDADGVQFLEDIRTDANTMAEVVDGLYRFSKVRSVSAIETELVDLNLVMREIYDTRARKQAFGEEYHLTWDRLPVVQGDKVLLIEVFSNLIENGLKFNRSAEKKVHVSYTMPHKCDNALNCTFTNRKCWCIKVLDNGVGIPEAYKHKLFQMFQRLHPEFPGTGVGLALVQTIVRKIGGEVMVQDNPSGQGTLFCIGLPW
jgi:PAS domain S-box-containing protein